MIPASVAVRLHDLLPKLPSLPLRTLNVSNTSVEVVSPCRPGGRTNLSHLNNDEPVEVYPIWPYAFLTGRNTGRDQDLQLGLRTFDHRTGGAGDNAWR